MGKGLVILLLILAIATPAYATSYTGMIYKIIKLLEQIEENTRGGCHA